MPYSAREDNPLPPFDMKSLEIDLAQYFWIFGLSDQTSGCALKTKQSFRRQNMPLHLFSYEGPSLELKPANSCFSGNLPGGDPVPVREDLRFENGFLRGIVNRLSEFGWQTGKICAWIFFYSHHSLSIGSNWKNGSGLEVNHCF